jgi:HD superfamily phosphohydrolase
LLHDVGHGPFSHAFEKITGDKHEKRTLEIINDTSTEVNQQLRAVDPKLPERLKVFFHKDVEDALEGADPLAHLTQIVDSQLDADRFDYLLRDSLATGTDYGQFDLEWLLQHIHIDDTKGRFYLGHKALYAAESYVFARYHMYRTVYFHKTTRAAEVMLRLLMRRYSTLLAACTTDEQRRSIAPEAPPAVRKAFTGKISLEQYLELDDHSLTEFGKACTQSPDPILKELSEGLLHRRLFKATDVTEKLAPHVVKFTDKAKEIVKAAGFDVDFAFEYDAPSDTAYKLYNPDAEKPNTQIYIEVPGSAYAELSTRADSVKAIAKEYTLVRYYYPASVRKSIRADAEPLLAKE